MLKVKFCYIFFAVGSRLIVNNIIYCNRGTSGTGWNIKCMLYLGIMFVILFHVGNSNNWNAVWLLGKAYQRLGKHEKAYEAFLTAYELEPQQPDVARELSGECMALARADEAIKYCIKAIENDPSDPSLQSNLALALAMSGKYKDAIVEAKSALVRDPNNVTTRNMVDYIERIADRKIPKPDRIEIY